MLKSWVLKLCGSTPGHFSFAPGKAGLCYPIFWVCLDKPILHSVFWPIIFGYHSDCLCTKWPKLLSLSSLPQPILLTYPAYHHHLLFFLQQSSSYGPRILTAVRAAEIERSEQEFSFFRFDYVVSIATGPVATVYCW